MQFLKGLYKVFSWLVWAFLIIYIACFEVNTDFGIPQITNPINTFFKAKVKPNKKETIAKLLKKEFEENKATCIKGESSFEKISHCQEMTGLVVAENLVSDPAQIRCIDTLFYKNGLNKVGGVTTDFWADNLSYYIEYIVNECKKK